MNALDVNFVKRRRLTSPLGLMLFVAGLMAASVVVMDYLDVSDELVRVELKQARTRQPKASPVQRASALPEVPVDTQVIDRVTSQLQLPWDAVLHEIETHTGPTVALLDIEAQGQTRTLRLMGETKTMSDAVAYVGRLRDSSLLDTANLSHHEERQAGSVVVIRFSVDATWKVPS
ncbi:PilN domain-containing protein [Rhodoferax sp. U11-2br]|uniref:PilN domain-containing protein n=1 Tax=Rhodoferax sp. U11-2br TaxID=2838878 RepID=UPI001BE6FB11|nr:PilN domain-containing protein [Rhodoferax sp. U11-2br]MBT3067993.1 hypothetical protein [Rhodoferax sp. U11-2br]